MGKRPYGGELIVIGNVNTDIADPEGNTRNKEILVSLVDAVLENMSSKSPLRCIPWSQYGLNWIILWKGR